MLRDASETAFAKIETNVMEQKDLFVVEVGTGRRKRLSLEVPIGVYPYIGVSHSYGFFNLRAVSARCAGSRRPSDELTGPIDIE